MKLLRLDKLDFEKREELESWDVDVILRETMEKRPGFLLTGKIWLPIGYLDALDTLYSLKGELDNKDEQLPVGAFTEVAPAAGESSLLMGLELKVLEPRLTRDFFWFLGEKRYHPKFEEIGMTNVPGRFGTEGHFQNMVPITAYRNKFRAIPIEMDEYVSDMVRIAKMRKDDDYWFTTGRVVAPGKRSIDILGPYVKELNIDARL